MVASYAEHVHQEIMEFFFNNYKDKFHIFRSDVPNERMVIYCDYFYRNMSILIFPPLVRIFPPSSHDKGELEILSSRDIHVLLKILGEQSCSPIRLKNVLIRTNWKDRLKERIDVLITLLEDEKYSTCKCGASLIAQGDVPSILHCPQCHGSTLDLKQHLNRYLKK